jgi:hypothetical protein
MNANSIWSGNDYAYLAGRGRGQSFGWGAERIRAIRVYPQMNSYSSERATSMVECVALNDDGESKKAYNGDDLIRNVRARDIIQRWEDYEAEREYRKEQQEKIERERRAKEQQEQDAKNAIFEALEAKGIQRNAVESITDWRISFNRAELEKWLGMGGE